MSEEENFDDIDESQPYVQLNLHPVLDLHIRAPEGPRSLQGTPTKAAERLVLKQRSDTKPGVSQVRSTSPRRTLKAGIGSSKQATKKTAPALQRYATQETHQPSLSPKSQRLKRDNKVEDILYQDAMRRMLKPQPQPVSAHKPAITPRSEELLAEALIREVECAWVRLRLKSRAGLNELGQVLIETRFLTTSEGELLGTVWATLKGEEVGYVSKQSLLNFLFALHALQYPARSVDTEATETDLTTLHFDSKLLRTRFKALLANKKKAHFKPTSTQTKFSFRPVLSPGSRKIAEKWSKTRPTASSEPTVIRLKTKVQKTSDSDLGTKAEMTFKPIYQPPKRPELRELAEELPEMIRVFPVTGESFVAPREPEEPVVLLNVTLPSEETVQFPLYEGDEIEARIREFAALRGLEKEAENRIIAEVLRHWPTVA